MIRPLVVGSGSGNVYVSFPSWRPFSKNLSASPCVVNRWLMSMLVDVLPRSLFDRFGFFLFLPPIQSFSLVWLCSCRHVSLCACFGDGCLHPSHAEIGCLLIMFCIPLMLHYESIKTPFIRKKNTSYVDRWDTIPTILGWLPGNDRVGRGTIHGGKWVDLCACYHWSSRPDTTITLPSWMHGRLIGRSIFGTF